MLLADHDILEYMVEHLLKNVSSEQKIKKQYGYSQNYESLRFGFARPPALIVTIV